MAVVAAILDPGPLHMEPNQYPKDKHCGVESLQKCLAGRGPIDERGQGCQAAGEALTHP